jgi:hypothetical protein
MSCLLQRRERLAPIRYLLRTGGQVLDLFRFADEIKEGGVLLQFDVTGHPGQNLDMLDVIGVWDVNVVVIESRRGFHEV